MPPGAIKTDRNIDALSQNGYEEVVSNFIPIRYIGQPDDIKGPAVYLCSEESQYMTDRGIYIGGGKGSEEDE